MCTFKIESKHHLRFVQVIQAYCVVWMVWRSPVSTFVLLFFPFITKWRRFSMLEANIFFSGYNLYSKIILYIFHAKQHLLWSLRTGKENKNNNYKKIQAEVLWNAALCTWHGSCMHELSSTLHIYKNSHKINPVKKYGNQWETAQNITSLGKVLLIRDTEEGSLFFWIWSSIDYQHPSRWSHI